MENTKNKIYAFIDATNIIYGASAMNWQVDFKKLFDFLKSRYRVSQIYYYAGIDIENQRQLNFYERLQNFGYTLRLIPVKTFSSGKKKADVDSRMTFEIMLYFREYREAIILTGDGDYYWVLKHLIVCNKKTILLSFPKQTARELKKLFGKDFANMNNLRDILEWRSD